VRDGDTLWDIARANGVTVKQLLAANGMRRPAIRPGQRLVLPSASETEAGQ
jgi:LysM repeat protein